MFTHQSPAMPSRYSRPSTSTTVESFADAITSWRSSSCRWGTMGWITLSRSRRTRSARDPAAGAAGVVVIVGILLVVLGAWRLEHTASRRPRHSRLTANSPVLYQAGAGESAHRDPLRRRAMFDWKMISSDSHVVEPPDLWTERMDRAFRDRAPRVVGEHDGDWWMIDGTRGNSFQGGAQVGKRFEHAEDLKPAARFSEVRPGAYQPTEFLRENEEDGIWASVIYPTAGLQLFMVPDLPLLSACFRAYNDWLVDFCAASPGRLRGIALINVEDVDEAVRELARTRQRGLAGAMITVAPPRTAATTTRCTSRSGPPRRTSTHPSACTWRRIAPRRIPTPRAIARRMRRSSPTPTTGCAWPSATSSSRACSSATPSCAWAPPSTRSPGSRTSSIASTTRTRSARGAPTGCATAPTRSPAISSAGTRSVASRRMRWASATGPSSA